MKSNNKYKEGLKKLILRMASVRWPAYKTAVIADDMPGSSGIYVCVRLTLCDKPFYCGSAISMEAATNALFNHDILIVSMLLDRMEHFLKKEHGIHLRCPVDQK